ncbi:MAG: tripartite tricarboxylate transporter substrate binding protein [Betaproteobacteria bacterium]|nr:tripartite tricarboxylate transporter substrate binding protein [Betaproteobacteria bacterium]
METRFGWLRGVMGAVLAIIATAAGAQDAPFPKRGNIEMTVLFPAGSSADVTARLLSAGLAKQLGVNVVAVNRPGAGGAIGYKHVAAQKPDGYSIVWNSNSISTTYHSGALAFDYRAFDPVARVLVESVVVAVRAESKWKTLKEFLADAKARPGGITLANSGIGSHTHLSGIALAKAADAQVTDVPYAAAQVVPNLIGGHVDAVVQFPGALAGHVAGGRVRVLVNLSAQRDPLFADVPTARELGLDLALDAWRGIATPRGTPQAVIAVLEKAIRETVQSAEFVSASEKLYVRPGFLPAAEFGKMIATEDAYLARIMEQTGLKKSP